LVIAIRLALLTIGFKRIRRIVERVSTPRVVSPKNSSEIASIIAEISRTVCTSSRWVPGATCLTRALAAQAMLRYEGLQSAIRIGVGPASAAQRFRAHAWLVCAGTVVVGGDVMADFIPLPPIIDRSGIQR
jgi:hypothetical protein